jgi:hypothetical protein
MPFAGSARHMLYSVAAVLAVVAIGGATFVWCTADASASATSAPAPDTTLPPPPSTTSSTTSSTTTSTSTSTSTSTTVKPKPVTTTAKPRPVAPATTPATAPPTTKPAPAPVALPGNFTAEERCANARQWVAEHGLVLPAGWGFRCPGQAIVDGAAKWGLACWNCNGDGQSWIAVDIGRIGASDKSLRYVIAHEICHAIDYMTLGISTEIGADLCAAVHGAPR